MSHDTLLKFADVELYYDHVYALKGVVAGGQRGRDGRPDRRQRRRQVVDPSRHHRPAQDQIGRDPSTTGERIDGASPDAIVKMGIAMVPEGRRVFPYMSVKDNLLMGAFTRSDKAEIASIARRWCSRGFRASRSAIPRPPAR